MPDPQTNPATVSENPAKVKRQMHLSELLTVIHTFETEKHQFICDTDFKGWNAWQILKKPVYYFIKNNIFKAPKPKGKTKKNLLKKALDLGYYFFKIVALVLTRRKSLLIFTNTNTKLARNKQGAYFDIIFDYFLLNVYKHSFIYIEGPDKDGFKSPVAIKHDLDMQGAGLLTFFMKKVFARDKELKSVATQYAAEFNEHFRNIGFDYTLSEQVVETLLLNFYSEYRFYRVIFALLRPGAVFFEDAIPAGNMAAARKMKIPSFEFQHGFFSDNKPDYSMNSYLKPLKHKMVLPDFVCVFGKFARDIMTGTGFWDENEILEIGNYRIEEYRQIKNKVHHFAIPGKVSLLLATQPSTFAQAHAILTSFAALKPEGINITIKCHIRDPQQNQEWFQRFAAEHADWVKMAPSDSNLVELMVQNDITASFYSTALFEAVALSVPVITIGSPEHPRGVYDFIDLDIEESIKIVNNSEELYRLIEQFRESADFRTYWQQLCERNASYFYSTLYFQNLIDLNERIGSLEVTYQ